MLFRSETSPSGITLKAYPNIKWQVFKVRAKTMPTSVSVNRWMPRHSFGCCSIQLVGGQCHSIHFGCRGMLSPQPKISFFLGFLMPNLSYITYNHKPSKYQGKMSKYSVKNKGLTWRMDHLSVHCKGLRIVILLDDF